jgi:hypothetical protein
MTLTTKTAFHDACIWRLYFEGKNAENVFLEEGYQDFLNDALDALKRSEKETEELCFELRDVKLTLCTM